MEQQPAAQGTDTGLSVWVPIAVFVAVLVLLAVPTWWALDTYVFDEPEVGIGSGTTTAPDATSSTSDDGWVVHLDESIGYELSYPVEWQIRDESDLESSDLSLATPEQIADVFEGRQPSTTPIILLTVGRPGSSQTGVVTVNSSEWTFDELVDSVSRDPGHQLHREVVAAGIRRVLVHYDYGLSSRLVRSFFLVDGILWSAACTFSSESDTSSQDTEVCETIATSLRLVDEAPSSSSTSDPKRPVVNIAFLKEATGSGSNSDAPTRMVDGDDETAWNSGGFPPQAFVIDFKQPSTIHAVRMLTSHSPPGETVHELHVWRSGESEPKLLHRFDAFTRDRQWLVFTPKTPIPDIERISVATTSSPSWVAWFEIQVLGTQE